MKECTVVAVRAAWAPPIIKDGLRILEGPSLVQGGAPKRSALGSGPDGQDRLQDRRRIYMPKCRPKSRNEIVTIHGAMFLEL